MNRYEIEGAHADSGDTVRMTIDAADEASARERAGAAKVLVSGVRRVAPGPKGQAGARHGEPTGVTARPSRLDGLPLERPGLDPVRDVQFFARDPAVFRMIPSILGVVSALGVFVAGRALYRDLWADASDGAWFTGLIVIGVLGLLCAMCLPVTLRQVRILPRWPEKDLPRGIRLFVSRRFEGTRGTEQAVLHAAENPVDLSAKIPPNHIFLGEVLPASYEES